MPLSRVRRSVAEFAELLVEEDFPDLRGIASRTGGRVSFRSAQRRKQNLPQAALRGMNVEQVNPETT